MELNRASWHASWFRWACRSLDQAWPRGACREYRYEWRTDLCTYFRTIGMGTLAAAYSLAAWAALVGVLTLWPIWLLGPLNYLFGLMMIAMIFLLAGGAVWVTTTGFPCVAARAREGFRHAAMVARDGTPTALALVVAQARAVKDRYCPTIRFRKDQTND